MKVFDEIYYVVKADFDLSVKYRLLYDLLDRVCIKLTEPLTANYNSLFTRLQALCRINSHPLQPVDDFRYKARKVKKGELKPTEAEFLVNVKALVDALARFTQSNPPRALLNILPDAPATPLRRKLQFRREKRRRFVITAKDEQFLYGVSGEEGDSETLRIDYHMNDHTIQSAKIINPGSQVNAVSFFVDHEEVIHPEILILEPDFLIDISSLSACIKPFGSSPYNFLLNRFDSQEMNIYKLLGQTANQFLDDCVNSPELNYETAMHKVFVDYALAFSTDPDIDSRFFEETRSQFKNIRSTIDRLRIDGTFKGDVLLEPSFFCETLGIQGRFDLLTADNSMLIELKSGKKDFSGRAKAEHTMQMLLYKEVMYYNLGVRHDKVSGNVLYSKYPELIEQRTLKTSVQEAMLLRNQIVFLERMIADGKAKRIFLNLTPEHLHTDKTCSSRFWKQYGRPVIERMLSPIQNMDSLTADYFFVFTEFIAREMMCAKVGDNRLHSTRSMAALWNADTDLKMENGDIIPGLHITSLRHNEYGAVEAVEIVTGNNEITGDTRPSEFQQISPFSAPNFRPGDSVVFYEREKDDDKVTNRQILRCAVEKINGNRLWLSLHAPMSGKSFFDKSKSYCIEHDHHESSFTKLYASLFSLLTTDTARRELLLCQRKPQADEPTDGFVSNSTVANIVERAARAQDFFLLVGPPGTGKTSVALRDMVLRFHSDRKQLLLAAYTNRAVDEICCMLESTGLEYVRQGNKLACDPAFHRRLLSSILSDCGRRTEVLEKLKNVDIIVSTVASLSSNLELLRLKHADVAIFDEASQILEPQILRLLCATDDSGQCLVRKFIMIGDHKQLPAVVVQPSRQSEVEVPSLKAIGLTNCRNSLFERLHHSVNDDPRFVAMLSRQGRMHTDIAEFTNRIFYHGKLEPVPLPHQTGPLPFDIPGRVVFIDVPQPPLEQRQSKMNVAEAEEVANLVVRLGHLYEKSGLMFDTAKMIGVIVPFRRQISLIREKLAEKGVDNPQSIIIDTVERFQGSQRDIIIYDTTISNDYELELLSEAVDIDGTLVDRKLNVALTRARSQMFIIGSKDILSQSPLYKSLIDFAEFPPSNL